MSDSQHGKAPTRTTQPGDEATYAVSPGMVRAACELIGRIDAARGEGPTRGDHGMTLLGAVGDLLGSQSPACSSWSYPRSGEGSLLGDWLRWYLDAYELELGNRGAR
jgi:hypothetical protein